MSVNNFFEKIFCINLDRRNDRWVENCIPQFEKLNLNVERFSAVDGTKLDLKHGYSYNGELAGSMSHLEVLKKSKELNLDKILILEDDVVFKDDLNVVFDQVINNIPDDWDIIFFGGNHVGGIRPVNNGVVKVNGSYAIHACGIRGKALDIMIKFLGDSIDNVINNKETRQTPSVAADYFLAKLHRVLNVYCFYPHIAWQKDGHSDIQNGYTNYNFLKN